MEKWNYACDYVIHSNMMQFLNSSNNSGAKSKLIMPESALYDPQFDDMSAEEVYNKLKSNYKESAKFGPQSRTAEQMRGSGNGGNGSGDGDGFGDVLDDHSKWYNNKTQKNKEAKSTEWDEHVIVAAEAMRGKMAGNLPGFLKRILKDLTEPQKNWRILLQEFCQQGINDYSFNPPDRRYSDCDFFLPDFNDTIDIVKDLLFFVDMSGSMDDRQVVACFSEINGAIHQFSGKLFGKVGFFDHIAYGLTDFEDVDDDITKIRPKGGGGTSFHAPFEYINKHLKDENITGIVILTDGICSFPEESIANGVPVLWVFTNGFKEAPWGLYTNLVS